MDDFAKTMGDQKPVTIEDAKKAGAPIKGDMEEDYTTFLKALMKLLDTKVIDPLIPESFLKKDEFEKLDEISQDKVSAKLINIADQIRHIESFYRSSDTPDSSPQLVTMIEALWHMTKSIEDEYGDVFHF